MLRRPFFFFVCCCYMDADLRWKAEKRRARVREKLLEHVAAALTVSSFAYSPTERGLSTPPATPERRARKMEGNKESITIYALLADVEQEILSSGVYQG